jgi:uncharacterized protein
MSTAPLMPKATAVWLVDNTSLTFDQIAEFCNLHPLEVKGIADGEVAAGIRGHDPITSGQLTRDEIAKAEGDGAYRLELAKSRVRIPEMKKVRGPRYTPLSRRQDRPNAILWLVRNHPELKDAQIMRLAGTTKSTLAAVRDRTHWNSPNLSPLDPVTLGLCSQLDLDFEVGRANKNRPIVADEGATLISAEITTGPDHEDALADSGIGQGYDDPSRETPRHEDVFRPSSEPVDAGTDEDEPAVNVDSVFSKLKELKTGED